MELTQRMRRFYRKPAIEKWKTIRFLARRQWANAAFLPMPISLDLAGAERLTFWWCDFCPEFDDAKGLLAFRGRDEVYLRCLCRLLRPGMVFFDIGAYHGLYGIVAGKKLAGDGRIVLFEPSARARKRIALHVALNSLVAVIEPYALSASRGQSKFFEVQTGTTTMSSLSKPATDSPVKQTTVDTMSLDEYCLSRAIGQLDIVKIDVEGAEMELFKGAERTLTALRPAIICEVLDLVTAPWNYPARDIVTQLGHFGYRWFDILADGAIAPHQIQVEYHEVKNYLALPGEKIAAAKQLIANH